jgi:hypothetical protein
MRVLLFVAAIIVGTAACKPNTNEVIEPSGPPPLPPASGSVIGYLIDAKRDLALSDDQLAKLERLDQSLAARNGQIDAQLRMIEKPAPAEQLTPQQMKAGEKEARYNNAPGASTMGTNDSLRLHKIRDDNDAAALNDALAVLDATQQVTAKRILQDRGVDVPGQTKNAPASDRDSGAPLPGMEP